MRRWVLLGAAVAVVGAAALAYAVARLNAYLATHRDALAAQASAALGRPVSFAEVRLSWRGGGSVRVTNLRVADDARFGGDLLTASAAVISVSLFDALGGRWRIRSAMLETPRLVLIGDAQGWNVESLLPLREASAAGASGVVPATPITAPPNAAIRNDVPPPLHIDAVHLRNGSVNITNRQRQPPATLTFEQVQLQLAQPENNEPIAVNGSATLAADGGVAAAVEGTVVPGAPPTGHVHVRWDPLPLALLRGAVPALDTLAANGTVGGDLFFTGPLAVSPSLPALLAGCRGTVTLQDIALQLPAVALPITALSGTLQLGPDAVELQQTTARVGGSPVAITCRATSAPPAEAHCRMTADAIGLGPLTGSEGTLRGVTLDANASLADGDPAIRAALTAQDAQWRDATARALHANGSLRGETIELEQITAEAFAGAAQGSGRCTGIAGAAPQCGGQVSVQGVQIGPVLSALRSPAEGQVDGRVTAELHASASGRDETALRRSLRGNGSVRVDNGSVQGVNLAQRVLGAIPGIDAVVHSGGRASRLLGGGATHFEHLSATVRIADERLASDDVTMTAEDFTVSASGSMRFAGALSGRGVFRGAAPLVDDIARGVPLLGSLAAGTKGLITIPFTVSGTVQDPQVEPDVRGVAAGFGRDVKSGIEALFGAPKDGKRGGVLRQPLDDLFGR